MSIETGGALAAEREQRENRRHRLAGSIGTALAVTTILAQLALAPGAHSHLVWLDIAHNGADLAGPLLLWLRGWLGARFERTGLKWLALLTIAGGLGAHSALVALAHAGGAPGGSAQGAVAGLVGFAGNLLTALVYLVYLGWRNRFARAAAVHALGDALSSLGPIVDWLATRAGHPRFGLIVGHWMATGVVVAGSWIYPDRHEHRH